MSNAKYIICETASGLEYPIVFPVFLDHKTMADNLVRYDNVTRAGFVEIFDAGPDAKRIGICVNGESTSTELKSDPDRDSELIRVLLEVM